MTTPSTSQITLSSQVMQYPFPIDPSSQVPQYTPITTLTLFFSNYHNTPQSPLLPHLDRYTAVLDPDPNKPFLPSLRPFPKLTLPSSYLLTPTLCTYMP